MEWEKERERSGREILRKSVIYSKQEREREKERGNIWERVNEKERERGGIFKSANECERVGAVGVKVVVCGRRRGREVFCGTIAGNTFVKSKLVTVFASN